MGNFRPSVRPVPIEVHLAGFPGKHYCPRMQTMNKPTFAAIDRYSPFKPVLVFVSSRRQTRLTAFELINYCTQDDNPYRFLTNSKTIPGSSNILPQDEMEAVCATVRDQALRRCLAFGIGIHHGGLSLHDRKTAESLFLEGKIQVLVCTATLAWGVNLPAHLVILKGTEFFDGKTSRYVDYPITDVLQMMGRAGRPQFDDKGVACILVHEPKKNFYRKFLYEPFPVESQLLKSEVLHDHVNAEVSSGSISSRYDAVNFLTWTFMWRRLVQNPTFYGLEDTSNEAVETFIINLMDGVLNSLDQCGCIAFDEASGEVQSLELGQIASRYYISFRTVSLFKSRLSSISDLSIEEVVRLVSDAPEYDELPVRHNEELLNAELAKFCPWEVDEFAMDDPHTKTFLLLQAHREGLQLPIQDYKTDTHSVLQQVPRIVNALAAVAESLDLTSHATTVRKYVKEIESTKTGGKSRRRNGKASGQTQKSHRQTQPKKRGKEQENGGESSVKGRSQKSRHRRRRNRR